jgi:hypothetical protein
MDDDNSARQSVAVCLPPQGVFQNVRIYIPAAILTIEEHWLGAEVVDGTTARNRCERRTEYFVARTHATDPQAELDGSSPAIECHGGKAQAPFEVAFKCSDILTGVRRSDGGDRLLYVMKLGAAHMGRREFDAFYS